MSVIAPFLVCIFYVTLSIVLRVALGRGFPDLRYVHDAVNWDTFQLIRDNVTHQYFTNEQMVAFMKGVAEECPDVISVFKFGETEDGADLLGMDVSSTAGERDAKPYFHWIANMHGNEPSGRQLTLALAMHLCEHKQDADVFQLLDEMHTIIVPTLNPDGFARDRRGNKNDVDLNRAFPDRIKRGSLNLTASGDEPAEVRALMSLVTSLPFSAGMNMHEGALVANFPWDGDTKVAHQPAPSPDDAAYRHLASAYAHMHSRMSRQAWPKGWPDTKRKEFFAEGITNGNEWYPVFGGMQDWIYIMGHCLEITLELWESKAPAPAHLPILWEENLKPLLEVPRLAVLGGLRGTVHGPTFASLTPLPTGLPTPSDPVSGAFHRPFAPGDYTISFSAPGFETLVQNITVPEDGSGVELHVVLSPNSLATENPLLAVPTWNGTFPFPWVAGRWNRDANSGDSGVTEEEQKDVQGADESQEKGQDGKASMAKRGAGNDASEEGQTVSSQDSVAGQQAEAKHSNQVRVGVVVSADDTERSLFWHAGRWVLFLLGVSWMGYYVWLFRLRVPIPRGARQQSLSVQRSSRGHSGHHGTTP